MIDAEYVRVMARYSAWQNRQLMDIVDAVNQDALTQDRGAFFGSILGTLNHLLWGDLLWLTRFDGKTPNAPELSSPPDWVSIWPSASAWSADRFRCDGRIIEWAKNLDNIDLRGDLEWTSVSAGKTFTQPLTLCVAQFFNHQTHHRGQVHAMLTGMGAPAPVSDLVLMPERF